MLKPTIYIPSQLAKLLVPILPILSVRMNEGCGPRAMGHRPLRLPSSCYDQGMVPVGSQ
jgi:hypothetical protein